MQTEAALTDLFSRLGAPDPAQWARSQIEEGIPQLARFLFLRQAWKLVLPNRDSRWIDEQTSVAPEEPGSAIGPALRRALAHGVEPDDLTAIVRGMQWHLLTRLCYLLDDPGSLEPEVRDIAWRLFHVDEQDRPIARMGQLSESVLETDPSGREMRSD